MKLFSWRNTRVLILLIILFFAAVFTKGQRLSSTQWIAPLEVAIYPINADGTPATARYIQKLTAKHFSAIDTFFANQGKKHKLSIQRPTHTQLGPQIKTQPPSQPDQNANPLSNILWGLRVRYWAWQNTPKNFATTDDQVRMYILYEQGQEGQALRHSVGLQKGLLGFVHAYAQRAQTQENNIIISHELLHTVGASDKYANNGEPQATRGYGNPEQKPLYPQRRAEIMAVRRALTATSSEMPKSLRSSVINSHTAKEINWISAED